MTALFAKSALLADGFAEDVRLTVSDGAISSIAIETTPRPGDVGVGIVVPGFVNAHSHAFQRALAGRTERRAAAGRDDFWTWREPMYRLAAAMNADRLRAIATQLYAEMLAAGYTSVVEFHYLLGGTGHDETPDVLLDALLAAANDSGIRLHYLPVLYERRDFGADDLEARQRRFALPLREFIAHYRNARARVAAPHSVGIGAHSLRSVSLDALSEIARVAADDRVTLHIHAAEQPREVEACFKAHRKRPVQLLLDSCAAGAGWTLVHATHLDAPETEALAASDAVACLCPSTEGNLGDGFFPLGRFLDAGGRIAIGSDSHVSIDPFEELRWLEYGQRLVAGRRNIAADAEMSTGARLATLAWQGGQLALGKRGGVIEEGAPADLLCLDASHPSLAGHGKDTLLDALVFTAAGSSIEHVMVNGQWCIDGGRHARADEFRDAYSAAVVDALAAGGTS